MSLSREEIIRMARESGIPLAWVSDTGVIQWSQLERFASAAYAAGAAAEREACAELCEVHGNGYCQPMVLMCAQLIRARGDK